MAPQVKPIMEAIDGDIALSFHGMTDNGRMPELSLIAELKDPAIMETIKGMIPVPMQEMAPGQYADVYKRQDVASDDKPVVSVAELGDGLV